MTKKESVQSSVDIKAQVKQHWEREACGSRYGHAREREDWFREISVKRYELEPFILQFADFPAATGKQVLEIGVGTGSDFAQWCAHAGHATGIDLTDEAIALTEERLRLATIPPSHYTLRRADTEDLPFADNTFDLVYSWGVLHHTPETTRAFGEAYRVLKPGGIIKSMVYHVPSWTGLLLYLRHGLARGRIGRSQKDVISHNLESPGTKAYTVEEANRVLAACGFVDVRLSTRLGPGDLLLIQPSTKYRSIFFKLVWQVYPRWFVRLLGDRFGLYLLIEAKKSLQAVNGDEEMRLI